MSKSPALTRLCADGVLEKSIQHAVEGEANLMTTDLWYLACTAILTAALWIPYIACQVMTNGPLSGENYVDPAPVPCPFGASVLIAPISTRSNALRLSPRSSSSPK